MEPLTEGWIGNLAEGLGPGQNHSHLFSFGSRNDLWHVGSSGKRKKKKVTKGGIPRKSPFFHDKGFELR